MCALHSAGQQSALVPGQLVYFSAERVAFHNVPLYSRVRRVLVITNCSAHQATHFNWHVTAQKDAQVFHLEIPSLEKQSEIG